MNFAVLSTDGHFETAAKGEFLRDWKFIDVSLADQTTQTFRKDQGDSPKKIWIRDRMLFLDFN